MCEKSVRFTLINLHFIFVIPILTFSFKKPALSNWSVSLSYTLDYLTQKLLPGVQIIWGQKLKFVKLFQFIYFMLVQFHVPTTWFYQSINNFTSRLSVNLPKRIYNSSSNWDTQVLVKLIISFQKRQKCIILKKQKKLILV